MAEKKLAAYGSLSSAPSSSSFLGVDDNEIVLGVGYEQDLSSSTDTDTEVGVPFLDDNSFTTMQSKLQARREREERKLNGGSGKRLSFAQLLLFGTGLLAITGLLILAASKSYNEDAATTFTSALNSTVVASNTDRRW